MKICLRCGSEYEHDGWFCMICGYEPEMRNGYPVFAPDILSDSIGYEVEYFEKLAALEPRVFWFEARNKLLQWVFRRYLPQSKGSFLEVGCGTGYVLEAVKAALPAWELYASDIFVEALPIANERIPDAMLMQIDARHIPFESHFDGIGLFDVIEHIVEDHDVLAQTLSALKPGGHLFLTVPQHSFLWSAFDQYAGHQRRYSRADLVNKVQAAGLEVLYVTSFVSLLLPGLVLSRKRQNFAQNYDIYAAFELGWLNTSLKKAMDVERALLRLGITFPAGGSLVLVARRPVTELTPIKIPV